MGMERTREHIAVAGSRRKGLAVESKIDGHSPLSSLMSLAGNKEPFFFIYFLFCQEDQIVTLPHGPLSHARIGYDWDEDQKSDKKKKKKFSAQMIIFSQSMTVL